MPRENITLKNDHVVSVGWSPIGPDDGSVQIGLDVGKEFMFVDDVYKRYTGLFADLTRADINKIIRELRKARDRAYGRDE